MKTKFYIVVSAVLFISCNSYEKIGDFKYKVSYERINTGEFNGLIKNIKSYYSPIKDTFLFGYTVKAQKLDFETEKDSIFTIGKFKYDIANKNIITTEIFLNGYDNFLQTDSIIRIFTQKKNGGIVLKEFKKYRNSIESQ
ncbi:hypothetical protein [Flavobacterium sp. DG2-3]|uniref:hypothetical protein n=1 Tax=Flavobacterium sp. DG2-3 TaxID=3068317 RepID=UPI00273F7827|nr:hypothetical protein [Flavobacterium sp. DG2-3]MDP5201337.1 hypothetical protein [Flavobacterium sp. DG2-3]